MNCQMILVISSPSISTTGVATLILDMPIGPFTTSSPLPCRPVTGSCRLLLPLPPRRLASRRWNSKSSDKQADTKSGEDGYVEPSTPRRQHACPPVGQDQPRDRGANQNSCEYQRTALEMVRTEPDYRECDTCPGDSQPVGQLLPLDRLL